MTPEEKIIADFLKPPAEGGAYTDEKLAALLAHAEDGKLSYISCCCVIGIPTANHALVGYRHDGVSERHYQTALRLLPNALVVENAFSALGREKWIGGGLSHRDAARCAALIPLIHAEMKRRELLRAPAEASEVVMA